MYVPIWTVTVNFNSYPVDLEEAIELSDDLLSKLDPRDKTFLVESSFFVSWFTFMWLHFRELNTSLSLAAVKWGYFLFLAGLKSLWLTHRPAASASFRSSSFLRRCRITSAPQPMWTMIWNRKWQCSFHRFFSKSLVSDNFVSESFLT